jgi:ectoine hydroxylase-related dioxygenase (phytanoyl-CoA dioxygenase family)
MTSAIGTDLATFNEQGFLVVDDVLDPERDLDPVVAEYEALLDSLVDRWHAEGKLPSRFHDLPFAQRFGRVLNDAPRELNVMSHFDISLPFEGVSEETPIHLGPQTFGLLRNPKLLDVVEQFIGGEIYSNPIQHTRIKPPEDALPEHLRGSSLLAKTDWHQDQGVHLPEADETDMLTVWLPLTDATEVNGCLCVIPGSHRQGLVTHCPRPGARIPDELLAGRPVALPVKRGGVLLFHHLTKHASRVNTSDGIRWSFDLRYHPVGQATGRPAFPGFVARSRQNPSSAVTDWRVWANLWRETRSRLATIHDAGKFTRWTGEEAICA